MSQVFLSPAARADLREIYDYVAVNNATAANELLNDIERACQNLVQHPLSGQSRDDLIPGMRLIVVRKMYVMCYRVTTGQIEIVRVVHGRRDFSKLFDY